MKVSPLGAVPSDGTIVPCAERGSAGPDGQPRAGRRAGSVRILFQRAVPAPATRLGDVLVTAAGVLRESCRLAADRMAVAHDVPGAAAGVTPGLLTSALRDRFPGVRVREVRMLAADAGTTQRARLAVTYDDP